MGPTITRRDWMTAAAATLGSGAPLRCQPLPAGVAQALSNVANREFAVLRGGLALARVPERELLFASDAKALSGTLLKPGSTVKPFLLAHLLETGELRPDEEFPCPGGALPVAGRRLDCSHAPQPGPLNPAMALALSCNRCFLHYAARLKGSTFAEILRRAGFGSRSAFAKHCAAAYVGNPASREAIQLQALGESDVLTTPLAMLDAWRRLLLRFRIEPNATSVRVLRKGMRECVQAGTGIGASVDGLLLGGKTGTGTSPERRYLNGWMMSYWPWNRPQLVMVVFVENGRGGAEAAPIAGSAWKAIQSAGALL